MNSNQPVVLISGCSSGIGLYAAQFMQQHGWQVIATARKNDHVLYLQSLGLTALQLDVADSESIAFCVAATLALTGGRLDAVFNNAGFGVPGAVEDLSRAAMRHQFETNVFGAIELTNAVLPLFRRQGHGRIVFNSSVLGFAAMPYRGAYNASKFALEGFADTLRQELIGTQIKVSLIEPGPIVSRFRANAYEEFKRWINSEASFHAPAYAAMARRLLKSGPPAPFTLPESAVAEVLLAALTSARPRARYRVTKPTQWFWYLKRVLPSAWLDRVLLKASGDEPGVAYGRRSE
ncbi:SDR family NAD(P)-dependent oxidoreductase [Chitinibacter tainanensis]|uniref:SDR family NAD(P)-dependent oxidoreductase n=1 Tax=Chitinibacter tainanensis TaxID=230667 RepID=UPI00040546DB|nr:SDR family NAD(P)-dependent oxidoreductase [Chitinibacter tainanensis]